MTLESCNYSVAIDLLKREFLNENLIINAIFNQILSYKPIYDPEYFNVSQFLAEISADLAEFKGSYDHDYFEEPSAENKLSHLICEKLPYIKRNEITPLWMTFSKATMKQSKHYYGQDFLQEKTEQFSNRRDNSITMKVVIVIFSLF